MPVLQDETMLQFLTMVRRISNNAAGPVWGVGRVVDGN